MRVNLKFGPTMPGEAVDVVTGANVVVDSFDFKNDKICGFCSRALIFGDCCSPCPGAKVIRLINVFVRLS